jgi:UDP-N-acetylmuramoyl-L-alanyl-D-glutamate--2,6-diaminopimelate ligase
MRKLETLLKEIHPLKVVGSIEKTISKLIIDSRKADKDALFFAWKGSLTDGHRFIDSAIEKGAVAIVCESIPDDPKEGITYLKVENTLSVVGKIASEWYDHPSKKLKVVGVTGTNGKTSVCTLLFDLYRSLGYKVGLLSTVENKINDAIIPSTHTTPDPVSIHALIGKMYDAGCDYVFMEVSSHAVDQKRIGGIDFDGALFTNISRDHLDYHKTFRDYIDAKKAFFDGLKKDAFALVNKDDKRGSVMVQNCNASNYTFSLLSLADFKGRLISNSLEGLEMKLGEIDFHSPMVGAYNASNLLAVYGVAKLLGQDELEVLTHLSALKGAKGRFEVYKSLEGTKGVVDYAHTPDALENVLEAIVEANLTGGKIITVVGCGGDRDKGKRPMMAKIAANLSDRVILTSDNPRTEDPDQILADMYEGVKGNLEDKVLVITDRSNAIKTAFQFAGTKDIVLVAGKGHENYQEIKNKRIHFDDAEEIKKHLKINHNH